ncbi:MAG: ABC transporter permease [Nitrospirae bacterium]|nr:ABC transporter permease [Nitrospirota bacterium]
MIRLANVRKSYRMGGSEVHALAGVSLSITEGEFIAIMGPSGSGKSTLLHILGLLDVPDSGDFEIMGSRISSLDEEERADLRGRSIGFVFQQFNLLPRLTALENVSLPLVYSRNGRRPDLAVQLLQTVGLSDRSRHRPNELSGGQQQRVAIARALVNSPPIILADEPTGNLDSQSEKEILDALRKLNADGKTIILVTHEADIARSAGRTIRMRDGLVQSDERVGAHKKPTDLPVTAGHVTCRTIRGAATYHGPIPSVAWGFQPASMDAPSKGAPTSNMDARIPMMQVPHHALSLRKLSDHARQAGRALRANKVRSGLSMLGILIGVAAVIATLALGEGARRSIEERLASMGSNLLVLRPGSARLHGVSREGPGVVRLTMDDAEAIRKSVPGVAKVAPTVSGRGQVVVGNKNWNTQILGAVPEYAGMRAASPGSGRFPTEEEMQRRARVAVLGMTPLRELFGDRNPLGEFIKINRVNFQVIGVLREKGASTWRDEDDIVVIPLSTAMRRLLGKEYVDSIDIEIASPDQMEDARTEIENLIMRTHRIPPSQPDTFQIRNMAEIQEALSETSRTLSWLLACIAAISLLVGGIGIMNILLVSVTERTREIGLRKAVGATRSDILGQFLVEAIVVSTLGGILGITLGWSLTQGMSRMAGWATAVSPGAVALAFFFSAAVGVVFGLWPARRAAALNPIDALRYE